MTSLHEQRSDTTASRRAHASDRVETCAASLLLDAAFANSREAVVIADHVGEIRYATTGTSLLVGHDATSMIGSSVFDYLHHDDVDAAAQLFVQRLDYDGADLGHAIRIRHSSGEWMPVVATAALLHRNDFGACAITLVSARDDDFIERSLRSQIVVGEFTNRLSAAFMEATTSSRVLERITDSIGEVGLLTGAEFVQVFLEHENSVIERLVEWVSPARASDTVLAVTGAPPIQPSVDILLDDLQVIDDARAIETPGLVEFSARMGSASMLSAPFRVGGQRGVLVLSRIVPGPDWIGADVDIARNTAALFGRALETARTEELLALTYREGPVGFSIRTWAGDLVDCNERYLDLYGLDRSTAQRTSLRELVHVRHRSSLGAQINQLRRGEIDRLRLDVEVSRGDGSTFWAQTHSVRLHAPGRSDSLMLTSVEDVTEIHAQRLELEFAALHDPLTGVANRAAMSAAIDRMHTTNGELPAVVVVDLDRFKLVNDSYGHDVGDDVLRVVAERITTVLRPGDLVARLGGDEFAIVLATLRRNDAEAVSRRLHDALDTPIAIAGHSIRQTMSIGVALSDGSHEAVEVLKRADRALYAAKANGRNTHVVFDETLESEVLARREVEHDLRDALANGELQMHFQPEYSLDDGRVLGAEALLRWVHPRRGLVQANEFILIAEQTGLIDDIGRFALREACRSFVQAEETEGLTLRVNISAREFSRPELPDLVEAALAESGLDPARLCLEMTETTLIGAPELALATFARLGALGVHSAIDDFGTGYSSLTYLKRFPVDTVKIDRDFVNDVVDDAESLAIVESILHLARALSLDVVAEGVETVEQVEVLRHLGCVRAQGYLVSKALPADELGTFLRQWRANPPAWATPT